MYHPIRFAAACIVVLGLIVWTLPDARAQARERTQGRTKTESSRTDRSTRTTNEATRQRDTAPPARAGRSPQENDRNARTSTGTRSSKGRATRTNDRDSRTSTGTRSSGSRTDTTPARTPAARPNTDRSARSGTRASEPQREDRVDQRSRTARERTDRQVRSTPSRTGNHDRYDRDRRDRYDRDRRGRGRYHRNKPVIVRPGGVKVYVGRPHVRVRPVVHVHIDIAWPWEYRHRHGWSPRYEYRQVVYVDAGWGHRHRESELDVRTIYRHRVRQATPRYAIVEIDIERIELYEDGYFVGEVRRIPSQLSRVQATLYRDGRMRFDRSVFLVGDPRSGFEMISTRYYDRYVLNAYRPSHGYRVGALDFRRERVVPVRYSRLFDPYTFDGYVPIALLPEERGWLGDYGEGAVSYYRYEDDWDDYGYYYGYSNRDARTYSQQQGAPRASMDGRATLTAADEPPAFPMLRQEKTQAIETDQGARITLNRTVEIRRLE